MQDMTKLKSERTHVTTGGNWYIAHDIVIGN